jgi:hypothetical protein
MNSSAKSVGANLIRTLGFTLGATTAWVALEAACLSAHAAETRVEGQRQSSSGCTYFSTTIGRFRLSYENRELPWGSRVDLIYGFEERENTPRARVTREWQERVEISVPATAPSTWSTDVSRVIESRGSAVSYKALQFVWKITLPSGTTFYDRGNDAPMGFYSAPFADLPLTCSGAAYQPIKLGSVAR